MYVASSSLSLSRLPLLTPPSRLKRATTNSVPLISSASFVGKDGRGRGYLLERKIGAASESRAAGGGIEESSERAGVGRGGRAAC